MKRLLIPALLTLLLLSTTANAQLRDELSSPYDYSGPIVKNEAQTVQGGLNRFFNSIEMSHSYEMSFNSFGGNFQNMNAYTNTLTFALSPDLQGRVDISFLHSPFGGNAAMGQNSFNNQVIIRNAELNYRISDKAFIRVQYQQLPRGYGFNPYEYGYNPFNRRYRGFNNYGFWY